MFSMTKKRRFLRGFSVVDFSAEEYIKNILQEMKTETATITIDYVLQNSGGSRPSYKGGPGHPDPEIRGGGQSPKNFFQPFGPQFGLKIRVGPGPCPRSTTA